MLLTLYMRKNKDKSVTAFKDKEGLENVGTWKEGFKGTPDKRFKYVMFNCYRWKIEWIL